MKPTHTFHKRDGTEITYVDYYKQVGLFPFVLISLLAQRSLRISFQVQQVPQLSGWVCLQHNSLTCPFPFIPAILGLTQTLTLSPIVLLSVACIIFLKSLSDNVTSMLKILPWFSIALGAKSKLLGGASKALYDLVTPCLLTLVSCCLHVFVVLDVCGSLSWLLFCAFSCTLLPLLGHPFVASQSLNTLRNSNIY